MLGEIRMQHRWIILAVLTFARTAMGFQFQSVAAISPFLTDRFQLSYTALGTLIGLYLFPGIAAALPGGILAQRFGDKRIACLGLAAMAFGGGLMAAADNYPLLVAGRIVSGTGAVFLNVLVTKMVTDWFHGREQGTAFGFLVTSWPFGIAIALIVLPALNAVSSWQAAFIAPAAISALALVLVTAVYRAPAGVAKQPIGRFEFDLTRHELKLATLAGAVWTFYNVGFILVLAFGPGFVVASGHSATAASAIVSTASWIILPAIPLGAWLAGRTGRADLVMIASFLLAGAVIALTAASGPSIALFALIGLLFAPPAGLIMTLPGEAVRAERRAIAIGIYFTCYYAGMGVLPALAGYARDLTGQSAAPLWFASAMMIISTLVLLKFRRTRTAVH